MNRKRMIGLVVFIIGIVLLIFGLYEKSRLTGARSDVGHMTHTPFGKNKVTDAVGNVLEGKISQYDQPVFWCIVGGIVLAVVGGGMLICCRSRKKRRK